MAGSDWDQADWDYAATLIMDFLNTYEGRVASQHPDAYVGQEADEEETQWLIATFLQFTKPYDPAQPRPQEPVQPS